MSNDNPMVWVCKSCGCWHGWADHPSIVKVVSHQRYSDCDVWRCPACKRELDTRYPEWYVQATLKELEDKRFERMRYEFEDRYGIPII